MNYKLFLILFTIIALASPVTATLINASIVVPTNYDSGVESANSGVYVSEWTYECPTGRVVELIGFNMLDYTSDKKVYFAFTRMSGEQITGNLYMHSYSLIESRVVTTLDAGTSVPGYTNFFNIFNFMPGMNAFYAYSNSTGKYYFVFTESGKFNYAPQSLVQSKPAPIDIDTQHDAYIELSGSPSSDPIISVDFTTESPRFTSIVYHVTLAKAQSDEQATSVVEDDTTQISTFLDVLIATYKALSDFFAGISTFLSWFIGYGLFFLAAQTFVGINAIYVIIAMVLSVHGTSNWVTGVKRFIRYMDKLIDFYFKIFKMLKEAIKWW